MRFQFKGDSNRRRRDADDSNGDPAPATGAPKQGRKGSDSKVFLVSTQYTIN